MIFITELQIDDYEKVHPKYHLVKPFAEANLLFQALHKFDLNLLANVDNVYLINTQSSIPENVFINILSNYSYDIKCYINKKWAEEILHLLPNSSQLENLNKTNIIVNLINKTTLISKTDLQKRIDKLIVSEGIFFYLNYCKSLTGDLIRELLKSSSAKYLKLFLSPQYVLGANLGKLIEVEPRLFLKVLNAYDKIKHASQDHNKIGSIDLYSEAKNYEKVFEKYFAEIDSQKKSYGRKKFAVIGTEKYLFGRLVQKIMPDIFPAKYSAVTNYDYILHNTEDFILCDLERLKNRRLDKLFRNINNRIHELTDHYVVFYSLKLLGVGLPQHFWQVELPDEKIIENYFSKALISLFLEKGILEGNPIYLGPVVKDNLFYQVFSDIGSFSQISEIVNMLGITKEIVFRNDPTFYYEMIFYINDKNKNNHTSIELNKDNEVWTIIEPGKDPISINKPDSRNFICLIIVLKYFELCDSEDPRLPVYELIHLTNLYMRKEKPKDEKYPGDSEVINLMRSTNAIKNYDYKKTKPEDKLLDDLRKRLFKNFSDLYINEEALLFLKNHVKEKANNYCLVQNPNDKPLKCKVTGDTKLNSLILSYLNSH